MQVLAEVELISFTVGSFIVAARWICAENSIGNTGMFLLLLSHAYTESGPFLPLTPPHQ